MNKVVNEIKEKYKLEKKIVFVSGNFNIIHPGHLRLLRFASKLGDLLVVGVCNKTSVGALIKENLRLEGIQSIGFVDFAFVFDCELEKLILELKPNIIVKGAEYKNRVNPEKSVLDSYGGELIFSSAKTTFSSLDLLKNEAQNIFNNYIEYPKEFLLRHKIISSKLISKIHDWQKLNVVVIGDLIIDEYITCEAIGMSQEDATIVVSPIDSKMYMGGAGIVSSHASKLGANVKYISVSGSDSTIAFAKKKFKEYNLDAHIFEDENRTTSLKQRYRTANKTLLKVSSLSQHDISDEMVEKIINHLISIIDSTDLVVLSDFNYGCLPQNLVNQIIQICLEKKIMMVADSQSSSQFGDISRFKLMELLTPTERESRLAISDFDSGLVVLSQKLLKKSKAKNIVTTLGEEGILIHTSKKNEQYFTDRIPALNSSPKDVAGAGDSFLIVCAMSLAIGCNIWESSYLASLAAAKQVSRIGNVPLSLDDIVNELNNCPIK